MRSQFRGSLFAAALLFPAMLAFDSPTPGFSYASGSRIWLEGTSSVRSYQCEAGRIDGAVRGPQARTIADLQAGVTGVDLAVPVATLDCGNGTMNGHMWKALDVEDHPFIRYSHGEHDVTVTGGGKGTIVMNGSLTIAGVTRPITLTASAVEQADGTIRVAGSKQIDMTDFGVRPPTLMMGALKVHAPVKVGFDLVLKP